MRMIDHARSVRHVFASNRGRTTLTLVGLMIGAGSIVLLAGLLRGGEEALLQTAQQANEADLLKVQRDDPPPREAHRTRRALGSADADTLAASPLLDGVTVAGESAREARAVYRGQKKPTRLVGATPGSRALNRLGVLRGRFLDDDDLASRARVAVVGWEIWRDLLGSPESLDGVTVRIADRDWAVVGVLADKPPLGGGAGTWMWNRKTLVPQTTYDAIFDPAHDRDRLYVRVGAAPALSRRMADAESILSGTLLRRHLGVHDFKIEGEEGADQQFHLVLDVIKLLLLGTGLLSLLVGGINIMNVMLVTVTERTREIGIRRALGATPRAVLAQFLLEAALIALAGGLVGVAGGLGFSWLAAKLLALLVGNWELHVEAWSIVLGLALSLATGVVFGLLPAWRAARLDPVTALRFE